MTFKQKLDEERRDAYAEGFMSNLHSALQNLIQRTGWPLEQAMAAAGVSEAEREEYLGSTPQPQSHCPTMVSGEK